MSAIRRALANPSFGPGPEPRLRAVHRAALAVLVGALALGTLNACRPGGTEAPAEETPTQEAAITGRCAEPVALTVPTGAVTGTSETWAPVTLPAAADCFRMSASEADAAGIPTTAEFRLESAEAIPPEDLEALLAVEPDVPFEVSEAARAADAGASRAWSGAPAVARAAENATHAYVVRPTDPLPAGSVIRFTLRDKPGGAVLGTWAFQAAAPLTVVQTLPEDASSGVPINTGVELTFSHDGIEGVEQAFTIEPSVTGTFETHGRTVVFVPEELAPDTLYTVRLASGVRVAGTDLSLDPFEMRFETGLEERTGQSVVARPAFEFSRLLWETAVGSTPALSMFSTESSPTTETPVTISLYSYADVGSFADSMAELGAIPDWATSTRAAFRVDVTSLQPALTFDATLQPLSDYGEVVFVFPDALDRGWYLVEAAVENGPVQAWLQVTDVASYVAVSDPRLLVWVNDAASGQPTSGATVTYGSDVSWETGADGVAFVDAPADMVTTEPLDWGGATSAAHGQLLVTTPDGGQAVVPLDENMRSSRVPGYRQFNSVGPADLYWRYVYTDRQLYRLTDALQFWGIARSRDGVAPVTAVTVELRGGPYTGIDYQQSVLARTTADVGEAGTYQGSLDFEGASPGMYSLVVTSGTDELRRTSVELRDFVTPAYKLDVRASTRAAYAEEPVTVTVSAAFFEGSPVPGLSLTVEGAVSRQLVTDATGRAVFTYTVGTADTPYGYDFSQVYVRPTLAEEAQISASTSLVVVPSGVTMEAAGELTQETGVVSGTVSTVDLGPVNSGATTDPTDFAAGPDVGRTVSAEVVEIVYKQVEIGTTYDFVNKRTVPAYRYDSEDVPAGTFTAVSDAEGRFSIAFPGKEDSSYRATVRVTDDLGRLTYREVYVGGQSSYDPYSRLEVVEESKGPYAVGDDVSLRVTMGNQDLSTGDRYLFLIAQNGVRRYEITPEPRYAFAFQEEDVPNVSVLVSRFVGGTYQEVPWDHVILFDSATRDLDVAVAAEKERYAPGEDVALEVSVTGADGEPARATVLLSAVDAAVEFLQGGGTGDQFRNSLYAPVGSGVVRTYASHQAPLGAPAAEGGGGGDGRGDFRDVVLFQEVRTDAAGKATASFTLPDNLTSWSVTALAVTDDLWAGSGSGQVPVGIPLFVDLTMNDEYVVGEQPVVRLRAYGEGLTEGADVAFELSSETLLAEPIKVGGKAFEGVDVPLPAMVEGRHSVRVTGTSGDMFDALIRPVSVVPSRLTAVMTTSAEVSRGEALPSSLVVDRGGTLTVTDANRGRYHDDLERLSWVYGDRLDQVLGRSLAATLLTTYFTTTQAVIPDVAAHVYQTEQGGAALVPYGDDDLTLSAQVAAADDQALGRQGLVQYFTSVLDSADSTPERRAEALAGLGCLGEPVLPAIQVVLTDQAERLAPRDALMLALAAAKLGDTTTADQVYRRVVTDLGEQRSGQIRLNTEGGRDASLEASALAAWLGAVVGEGTAPELYEYVSGDTAQETVLTLLQIGYLGAAMPRMAADEARVAYTLDGERQTEDVPPGTSLALQLTADDLAGLELEVLRGRVGVDVSSLAPIDPATGKTDPNVQVARAYRVQQPAAPGDQAAVEPPEATGDEAEEAVPTALAEPVTDFVDGDLVRVTLDTALAEGADDGCYQLTDLLPSGLVAVTAPSQGDQVYYEGIDDPDLVFPYQVVGQRVSFCVWRDGKVDSLSYLARVITKGSYVAEPAVLQAMEVPESRNVSSSAQITIR